MNSPYRQAERPALEAHVLWFPKVCEVVRIVAGRIHCPREVGRLGVVADITVIDHDMPSSNAMYFVRFPRADRRQGVRRLETPTTGIFFLDELEAVAWPLGAETAERA